ncbi:MAG: hypothetical protein ACK53Y_14530, partial [bacterium]
AQPAPPLPNLPRPPCLGLGQAGHHHLLSALCSQCCLSPLPPLPPGQPRPGAGLGGRGLAC